MKTSMWVCALLVMAFGCGSAMAQTSGKPDNWVAVDQCKAVKPENGIYAESHMEYHCTFHFAVADASKGKACVLVTTTPPAKYPLPCQVKEQQQYEEAIEITEGSPAQTVYTVKQGDTTIGAVTVKWDEVNEWLTVTGNYGGNYKATSPCAGTTGGSC
jgi:hypothetical protein